MVSLQYNIYYTNYILEDIYQIIYIENICFIKTYYEKNTFLTKNAQNYFYS